MLRPWKRLGGSNSILGFASGGEGAEHFNNLQREVFSTSGAEVFSKCHIADIWGLVRSFENTQEGLLFSFFVLF
jgi:hypothetical protein